MTQKDYNDISDLTHSDAEIDESIVFATLGENIERALLDKTSPFAQMILRARREFLDALHDLLAVDLNSPDGINTAKSIQERANRYRSLALWVHQAISDGEKAIDDLAEIEGENDEAIETLREQMKGRRHDKPAFDA